MKTRHVPNLVCPHCGREADGISAAHDHIPCDGDISICAYCTKVSTFTRDGKLVPAAHEDIDRASGFKEAYDLLLKVRDRLIAEN